MLERVSDMTIRLNTARQQSLELQSELDQVQRRLEEQGRRYDDDKEELYREIEAKTIAIEKVKTQLQTEASLVTVLKRGRDELQERVNTLMHTVDRVNREMSEAVGERDRLKMRLSMLEKTHEEERKEREKEKEEEEKKRYSIMEECRTLKQKVRDLSEEVERSKEGLTEPVQTVSPPSTMTVTEAYSKYIAVSQELRSSQRECRVLEASLERLRREMEEKEPEIKAQKEQYSRLAQYNAQLTVTLREMTQRYETANNELDEVCIEM